MSSQFVAQGIDTSAIVWTCQAVSECGKAQHVGNIPPEVLAAGVDIDDFVSGMFADLAIYDGSLDLRLILPCGSLVELSAETSVEFGSEVLSVTFTGLVPDWIAGRWAP